MQHANVRQGLTVVGGLAVLVVFSVGGGWLAARLGMAVPGAVLGMGAYTVLLLLTPWFDWTLPAARGLAGLLGALIVPALVGIALFGDEVARGGWRLALVLVLSTALTGLATAWLFRAVGGRA